MQLYLVLTRFETQKPHEHVLQEYKWDSAIPAYISIRQFDSTYSECARRQGDNNIPGEPNLSLGEEVALVPRFSPPVIAHDCGKKNPVDQVFCRQVLFAAKIDTNIANHNVQKAFGNMLVESKPDSRVNTKNKR